MWSAFFSSQNKTYLTFLLVSLLFILFFCFLWAIGQGDFELHWWQAGGLIFHKMSSFYEQKETIAPAIPDVVLFELRLPRIVMSMLTGAALSVAGVAMQGLFRNALADPTLIGVSSGAAVGAALSLLGTPFFLAFPEYLTSWFIAFNAFFGGLISTILVYYFSRYQGRIILSWMLIIGIAMSTLSGAIIGFLSYFSSNEALRRFAFWSLGNLNNLQSESILLMGIVFVGCFWGLQREALALNVLCLGEREASTLGIPLKQLKLKIITLTALLVSTNVAICGLIGFVSLIIPHIMRLLVGANHRILYTFSALGGALLLLLADTVARTCLAPIELPVGIVTALLGVPFFLILFIQKRHALE